MLSLGIIGCGKVTTMFHLKAIAEVEEVEVTAVADLNRHRMEEAKKKAGAEKGYLDPQELFKDNKAEVIVINTPPRFHEEMTLRALAAGKHSLVEKPLARSIEGCRRIQEAKREGLIVLPVHNYAFTPCLNTALELIGEGEIGALVGLEVRFYNNLWSYGAKTDFRMNEPHAIVEDILPHTLSVVQALAGPIRKVMSTEGLRKRYNVVDNLKVKLETERSIWVKGEMNWTSIIPAFHVRVLGEEGRLDLELMKSPYTVLMKTTHEDRKIGGRGLGWLLDLIRLKHPAFVGQYEHLVKVVREKEPPVFTVEDEASMLVIMGEVAEILSDADMMDD
jgi:predicted dehydrogenase